MSCSFELRQRELNQQCSLVNQLMERIVDKENEFYQIIEDKRQVYYNFRYSELSQEISNSTNLIRAVDIILDQYKNNSDIFNKEKINGYIFKITSIFSKSKKQTIADWLKLKKFFAQLSTDLSISKDFNSYSFIGDIVENKQLLQNFKSEIIQVKTNFSSKIFHEFENLDFKSFIYYSSNHSEINTFDSFLNDNYNFPDFVVMLHRIKNELIEHVTNWHLFLQYLTDSLKKFKDFQKEYNFGDTLASKMSILPFIREDINKIKADFSDKIQNEFNQINLLTTVIQLPSIPILKEEIQILTNRILSDNWTLFSNQNNYRNFITNVDKIIEKKEQYFGNELDIFTLQFKWYRYYNTLNEENKMLINELQNRNNWGRTFSVYYLHTLLTQSHDITLPTDDSQYTELNEISNGLEKEQLKYIRDSWSVKQKNIKAEFEQKNGDFLVKNLYNLRSGSKFRRNSLRQIVKSDPNLFTTFFPIILTTPDVCSNLFKGMNGYFDIVMFDEASQLKLEDNLPAILKGKQVIIAGDEHQMPPSNYFSKVFDGAVEDEEDVDEEDDIKFDKDNSLLSCESLLDFAIELNFEKKFLDFHYRSKHPLSY